MATKSQANNTTWYWAEDPMTCSASTTRAGSDRVLSVTLYREKLTGMSQREQGCGRLCPWLSLPNLILNRPKFSVPVPVAQRDCSYWQLPPQNGCHRDEKSFSGLMCHRWADGVWEAVAQNAYLSVDSITCKNWIQVAKEGDGFPVIGCYVWWRWGWGAGVSLFDGSVSFQFVSPFILLCFPLLRTECRGPARWANTLISSPRFTLRHDLVKLLRQALNLWSSCLSFPNRWDFRLVQPSTAHNFFKKIKVLVLNQGRE